MQRALVVTALMSLCCASCAAMEQALVDTRLVEAQRAFDEAQRLQETGQYAEALPLMQRTLDLREAALGKNHPDVAISLSILGRFYEEQGLYARAEPLFERALELREADLGKNHPLLAASLTNLASLYYSQGLYARAEPLLERALELLEAALGKNHPDIEPSVDSLGGRYHSQGLYTRTEPLPLRVFSIDEASLRNIPPSILNLGLLYGLQGRYTRAPLLRAFASRESSFEKNHPKVSDVHNDLGRLRMAQQRPGEALSHFKRAFITSEEQLRQEIFGFSEARLASILRQLRDDEERLYSLVRARPDDAHVRRLALSAALLRKGRSVEEVADTSRIIYRSLDPAGRETFERLRALRTQLSTLSLAGPGSSPPADYQKRLEELVAQGDALEADLSRRSAPLRALSALPPPDQVVDHVTQALPRDSALVEFVAYRDSPLVPKPGTPPSRIPSEPRYLALLLFPDGRIGMLDLGPTGPIDSAVLRLQGTLTRAETAYEPAAQALYTLVFRPLVPQLGGAQRLFLSPDGQLALIPFAVLHDGSGLVVNPLDITYLTSGKDLLPRVQEHAPARSVVVLADPEFVDPAAAPLPLLRAHLPWLSARRRSSASSPR